MKKMLLILSLAWLTLACGLVDSTQRLPTKTRIPPTAVQNDPTRVPAATQEGLHSMTRVALERSDGEFLVQMRAQVEQAALLGQVPFVEFTANW